MKILLPIALVGALLGGGCGTDSTGPTPSLVGAWDLIGFTDMGAAAVTTGTAGLPPWSLRSLRVTNLSLLLSEA